MPKSGSWSIFYRNTIFWVCVCMCGICVCGGAHVRVDVYEYGGQSTRTNSGICPCLPWTCVRQASFQLFAIASANRLGALQVQDSPVSTSLLVIGIPELQVCYSVPSFYVGSVTFPGKQCPTEPSSLQSPRPYASYTCV